MAATMSPKLVVVLNLNDMGFHKGMQAAVKDLGQLDHAAEQSTRKIGILGKTMGGLGTAAKLGGAAVLGIGAIGGAFAVMGIKANASAEQAKMALETVTGSAKRADELFTNLQAFAAKTPFEFPELVQASINLESFGIKTEDWLTTIGDTAAAMGKSIDQVTQAVLDAATGEFERLKELGISTTREGDKLTFHYMKNGKEITKTVDKNNKEIMLSTIQAIWNDKYAGAMEKQSKTFMGQWSTLKDNFNQVIMQITLPLFRLLTRFLGFANRWLSKIIGYMGVFRKKGLNPVSALLRGLGTQLEHVKTGIKPLDRIINDVGHAIAYAAQAFHDLLSGNPDKALKHLGDVFRFLWDAVKTGFAAVPWRDIGQAVWDGVKTIFGLIPWDWVKDTLWSGVQRAWGFLTDTALPWLAGEVWNFVKGAWDAIDWDAVGETVWSGVQTAIAFVTDTAPKWLTEQGKKLVDALFGIDWTTAGQNAWAGIKTAVGTAVDLALGAATWLASEGYDLLKGLWNLDWKQVATDVWNGVWSALQMVKTLGGIALDAVIELGGDLKMIRDDAATWLKTAMNWTGDKTIDVGKLVLKSDVTIVDTSGQETGGSAEGAGKSWVGRFFDGVKNALDSAVDIYNEIASKIAYGIGVGIGATAGAFLDVAGAIVWAIKTAFDDPSQLADKALAMGEAFVDFSKYVFTKLVVEGLIAIGLSLAEGILQGFDLTAADKGATDSTTDKIQSWIDRIREFLGISSPSTVFAAIGQSLVDGLLSAFKMGDILAYFTGIGRAIVGGMVMGIASMWGAFAAQINALIAKATEVKQALSISSPSGFMVDVFSNYMKGAVVGIEKGMPAFARAVGGVTATAMGGSPSLGVRPVTPNLAMAGAGNSVTTNRGPITVNVYESSSAQATAREVLRAIRYVDAGLP